MKIFNPRCIHGDNLKNLKHVVVMFMQDQYFTKVGNNILLQRTNGVSRQPKL